MQEPTSIPHGVTNILWYAVATFLASLFGGGVISLIVAAFLNRNKSKAEVHNTDAGTLKVLAEVRQIDTQTTISAGDAVLRMANQLAFRELKNQEQDAEIDRLQNENEAYERQIRWAKGIFRVRGIKWDDDPPH